MSFDDYVDNIRKQGSELRYLDCEHDDAIKSRILLSNLVSAYEEFLRNILKQAATGSMRRFDDLCNKLLTQSLNENLKIGDFNDFHLKTDEIERQ